MHPSMNVQSNNLKSLADDTFHVYAYNDYQHRLRRILQMITMLHFHSIFKEFYYVLLYLLFPIQSNIFTLA